ncbi:MAG: TatD family hydrolase, partial [Christensenellaceae bacterium]|nr:TatD family hydrolase [Christensenellaceae bacterium]
MTRFADSHCHILDPRLIDRAESIVKNMSSDGLDFIVEVSASIPESYESVKFAMAHDNVFCAIGVHPEFAKTYPEDADEFAHWALSQHGNKKIVGYGECGLDYKYSHDAEAQKQCFTHQILLADKLGLPLIVHTRQAFDDTLQILVENKAHIRNGLLFHCFCEGTSEATRVLEHFDAYFAFGGAVTHTPNTLDDTIRTT